MNVFIIDDNLTLAYMLSQWFDYKGHNADYETNPCVVMDMIKNGELDGYDYILLDLLLNGVSGIDIFEALKKRNIHNKVVVISGCDVRTEIFQKALSFNVPIITKTFDSEELVERLENGSIKDLCTVNLQNSAI